MADPVEAPADVAPAGGGAPTFVSCQMADGTGLMSDGTTMYVASCDESAGGPMTLQDGTSIYSHLPPAAPTFDPNSADGYGPNQPLPPFCERFPNHETC